LQPSRPDVPRLRERVEHLVGLPPASDPCSLAVPVAPGHEVSSQVLPVPPAAVAAEISIGRGALAGGSSGDATSYGLVADGPWSTRLALGRTRSPECCCNGTIRSESIRPVSTSIRR